MQQFNKMMPTEEKKLTPSAQKLIAILIFISLLFFAKLAPYGSEPIIGNSFSKQIFLLYFFIVSQTLGIVHEGGHGICYILHCPQFFTALNGTLFQLLFPLGVGIYYKRRGQIFPYLVALFIFGISLHYTAWYISTAGEGLYLPASKSFLGVDGLHDFNYILTQLHLLSYHGFIAGFTRFIAYMFMLYASGRLLLLAFFSPSDKNKRRRKLHRD